MAKLLHDLQIAGSTNDGADKSIVDDFVRMGYCKHESRLCPTIC